MGGKALLLVAVLAVAVQGDLVRDYLRARRKNPKLEDDVVKPYTLANEQPGDKCNFSGCTDDGPFVYLVTSHRGRASSYNRLIRSLARDLGNATMLPPGFNPQCVCATIGDFPVQDGGPTVQDALLDWPYSKHVVVLNGSFSKTSGFQAVLDTVIITPLNQSLVFMADADMVAFPGFIHQLVTQTKLGKAAFAPIVWSQADPTSPEADPTQGVWRTGGLGNIAYYMSDFHEMVGTRLPMLGRSEWGGEDVALAVVLHHWKDPALEYGVHRACSPRLWHMFHHHGLWARSHDGRTAKDARSGGDWRLALPPNNMLKELLIRGELHAPDCKIRKNKQGREVMW